jgi:hypothetical protein
MLEVKFFFSLVEVVRFFVIYDLARNKTGSVKDGMTELYKNDKQKINLKHRNVTFLIQSPFF